MNKIWVYHYDPKSKQAMKRFFGSKSCAEIDHDWYNNDLGLLLSTFESIGYKQL